MKSVITLLAAALLSLPVHADDDEGVDLIDNMRALQYFTHKAALAVDRRNKPLADFYAHELEEALEQGMGIEKYHDQPIGALTKAMLWPAFERFEEVLDAPKTDWKQVSRQVDEMIGACNACHQATGYGFISLKRSRKNPFMQSFEPAKP